MYGDERGLLTLGRGWSRSLLSDALALVPAGEWVFACVSPGNARSLRAFLGVGFRPLGSEGCSTPQPARPVLCREQRRLQPNWIAKVLVE